MTYEQSRMPGMGEPGIFADLTVSTQAWLAALSAIERVSRNQASDAEASLELGGSEVKLTYAGRTVVVPANGEGHGCAIFSSTYVRPLLTVARLVGASFVRLSADEDGALFIGTTRVACRWQKVPQGTIRLSPGASLPEILRLRYLHPQEEIASAGLADELFNAECCKADLISRAAEILCPLGVSLPALDRFVNDLAKQ